MSGNDKSERPESPFSWKGIVEGIKRAIKNRSINPYAGLGAAKQEKPAEKPADESLGRYETGRPNIFTNVQLALLAERDFQRERYGRELENRLTRYRQELNNQLERYGSRR